MGRGGVGLRAGEHGEPREGEQGLGTSNQQGRREKQDATDIFEMGQQRLGKQALTNYGNKYSNLR